MAGRGNEARTDAKASTTNPIRRRTGSKPPILRHAIDELITTFIDPPYPNPFAKLACRRPNFKPRLADIDATGAVS